MGTHRLHPRSSTRGASAHAERDTWLRAPQKTLWLPLLIGVAGAIYVASWSWAWQIQVSLWILAGAGLIAWALGHRSVGGRIWNPRDAPTALRRELVYLAVGALAAFELLGIAWLVGPRSVVPALAFVILFVGTIVHQYRYGAVVDRLGRGDAPEPGLPSGHEPLGLPESRTAGSGNGNGLSSEIAESAGG